MDNNKGWTASVISRRQPMEPIATDTRPQLQVIPSVRAVIFDVYGTLVISGSGDVGSADSSSNESHVAAAMIDAAYCAFCSNNSGKHGFTRPAVP